MTHSFGSAVRERPSTEGLNRFEVQGPRYLTLNWAVFGFGPGMPGFERVQWLADFETLDEAQDEVDALYLSLSK